MSISDYAELKILDAVLRFTTTGGGLPTASVYVSLHTADPGETGASEATGGSYARQQAAFNAASGGVSVNTAVVAFTGMPAATITHIALWDAVSAGNCLWSGSFSASQAVLVGNTVSIAAGTISVSLD